jgi:hypothetical protein
VIFVIGMINMIGIMSEPLIFVPELDSGFMIGVIGIISVLSATGRHCEERSDEESENSFLQKNSQFSPV